MNDLDFGFLLISLRHEKYIASEYEISDKPFY